MTFSIVARDAETGAFGVATATGGPVVGSLVPHAAAGVGAIATQGYTNPLYGIDGLAALAGGTEAEAVIAALTGADTGRDRRQVIAIDRNGNTAGWSGGALTPHSGMRLEQGVAVAGNLLADLSVLDAMLGAYQAAGEAPLERRLFAALEAGAGKGGDARGVRSGAILTYLDQPYPHYDMRIDFAPDPIAALRDLFVEVDRPDYSGFYKGLPRRPV
ncbi:DUF1028 domain-containing protein [Pelagibacterium limicola]|uniref:DUF1028 domain-containing protein n=1 Tax=Pelagibacterium limicola TaxID=2791022 RepID=UPI0018AFFA6A|nr:DUF1028 domain-containing protein [Pelagibacterium limicola]